jgi:hypothetical protein
VLLFFDVPFQRQSFVSTGIRLAGFLSSVIRQSHQERVYMTTKAVEQELLALEKQYWQAMKDKDADTAMRLSDDPCLIAGPMGIMRIERQALKGMLRAAPYTLNDFSIPGADAWRRDRRCRLQRSRRTYGGRQAG